MGEANLARPALDMIGDQPKVKLRITVAEIVRERARQLRSECPDEVVNDAQAIRILLKQGLGAIEDGLVPSASAIKAALPSGGNAKDIKIWKSDFSRLQTYYKANVHDVDGVAGAARHALWIAVSQLDPVANASVHMATAES